jgi:hypothetical protein
MNTLRTLVCATLGVMFPLVALAQSAPPQARPDPTDATVSVPPLHYESALQTYRQLDDKAEPTKVWRSANDLVRDTGSMSGMSMGDEPDNMQDMDHGAMKNMKGMQMDGMEMKQSTSKNSKPAKQKMPPKQDSMPGMDMSTKHGKEMP